MNILICYMPKTELRMRRYDTMNRSIWIWDFWDLEEKPPPRSRVCTCPEVHRGLAGVDGRAAAGVEGGRGGRGEERPGRHWWWRAARDWSGGRAGRPRRWWRWPEWRGRGGGGGARRRLGRRSGAGAGGGRRQAGPGRAVDGPERAWRRGAMMWSGGATWQLPVGGGGDVRRVRTRPARGETKGARLGWI